VTPRVLYLCAFAPSVTMSYFQDYADAFARAGARVANLGSHSTLTQARALAGLPLARCDHVVFGYSFFYGISRRLLPLLGAWLRLAGRRRNVFFMQNEYRLFRDKLGMAARLSCAYVTTQLPLESARALYGPASPARVLPMPHALNEHAFASRPETGSGPSPRPLDIGCRSAVYPAYLGDQARQEFLTLLHRRALERGLASDVLVTNDPARRFDRDGWAAFLNTCRFTVSTEAGAAALDIDDHTRHAVNAYVAGHPEAPFAEIEARFFAGPAAGAVCGKCISSRHFDAIGTRTGQILLEGHYNGLLTPGEHYIEVRRDLSNLDEVLDRLGDEPGRRAMVERAHAHAMRHHTIDRRVHDLLAALEEEEHHP
jgi:hypothetical protein